MKEGYVIYDFDTKVNRIRYSFDKPLNALVPTLVSVTLAIACGLLLRFAFPDFGNMAVEIFIDPLCSKLLSVLTLFATPMMFFLLVTTIGGLGSRRQLGNLGKRLVLGTWPTVLIVAVSMLGLFMLFFGFREATDPGIGNENDAFSSIRDLILGIIPANSLDPFITGNALQVVFMALVIGVAIFINKSENTRLVEVNAQIDGVFQTIMTVINGFMPVYVFFSLTSLVMTLDISVFSGAWKFLILFAAMFLIYFLVIFIRLQFIAKLNVANTFIKISRPATIVLSTASSLAALQTGIDVLSKNPDGPEEKSGLGYPEIQVKFFMGLGRTVCKVISASLYITVACYFASMSPETNMNVAWYISAFITCLILGVATPPIPGGAKTCYAILFAQLGIPSSTLPIVLSMDTILDYPCTGGETAGLVSQIACICGKMEKQKKASDAD